MSSLIRGNFRMAIASIKSTKWRSGFTMLGVVVAVVPVLLILGIGEGVKRQISDQVTNLGSDMLTIRPGAFTRDKNVLTQFNTLSGYSSRGVFTSKDLAAVREVRLVNQVTPVSVVPGTIEVNDTTVNQPFVVGTTEEFPALINRSVQHGEFFSERDYSRRVAVIGREAAEEIFGESIPLGRGFDFHGQTFIVRGILERFTTPPLSFSADFNTAVIIPHAVATELSGNSSINEILVRPVEGVSADKAAQAVTSALSASRGGSTDFSVLTQAENLRIANRILTLLTALVTAVAGIALLVSGIGIMNIMLVSVTERMHEIGVRKAIGATKRQILGQFMAESALLSTVGGLVGILLAFVIQYFTRLLTAVEPVITWQATVLVAGISLAVGIVFGTIPALKAARKDPIDALRHE